jgi:transposase-like protein
MGRVASEELALVWRRRIARHRRSQLSVAEFCGQEGVSSKSFYVWRKRLQEAEARQAEPSASSLFVPVTLPLASVSAGGLRIELPSGTVLTLPADAPAELVTTVIRAAMSSASNEERPSC